MDSSMNSKERSIWFTNTGAVLIVLVSQPSDQIDFDPPQLPDLNHFYNTNTYRFVKAQFASHFITFIEYNAVHQAPSQELFLEKIYVQQMGNGLSNRKYIVHFPVFMLDEDLYRLNRLNLYEAFPNQQILVQYFHIDPLGSHRGFQITKQFRVDHWFDVIHLNRSRPNYHRHILIKNKGRKSRNGYVAARKVEKVVLDELRKNESFQFKVHLMANKVNTQNHRGQRLSLIISMEITMQKSKDKVDKHFKTILNEMNRQLTNNFNDGNNTYLGETINNATPSFMDFGTAMDPKTFNIRDIREPQWYHDHGPINQDELYVKMGNQKRVHYRDADIMSRYHGKLEMASRRSRNQRSSSYQNHDVCSQSQYDYDNESVRSAPQSHPSRSVPARRSMSVCAQPNRSSINSNTYSNQRQYGRYDQHHDLRQRQHGQRPSYSQYSKSPEPSNASRHKPHQHHVVHAPLSQRAKSPPIDPPISPMVNINRHSNPPPPPQHHAQHHHQRSVPSPPHGLNIDTSTNPEYENTSSEDEDGNQSYYGPQAPPPVEEHENFGHFDEIRSVQSGIYNHCDGNHDGIRSVHGVHPQSHSIHNHSDGSGSSHHSGNCSSSSSATPLPLPMHHQLNRLNLSQHDDDEKRGGNFDAMTHSTFVDDALSCYLPGASKSRNKERARHREELKREKVMETNSDQTSPGQLRVEVVDEKKEDRDGGQSQVVIDGHRSDSGLNEERMDYRGFVIPSKEYGHSSVIIDVENSKMEEQYRVVDHNGNMLWIDVPSHVLHVNATDMKGKSAEDRIPILTELTPKQTAYLMVALESRCNANGRDSCIV